MNRPAIILLTFGAFAACTDAGMQPVTTPEVAFSHDENAKFADAAPTRTFDVTVENLTDGGQHFTPPLIAIHRGALSFFAVGQPASMGIQQIAENGNLDPMINRVSASRHLSSYAVAVSGEGLEGPLAPGEAVTVPLSANPGSEFVSVVSMLICSNDGFTGTSGTKLPNTVGEEIHLYLSAFDAGTEVNTQDFADLVPPCPVLSGVPSTEPGTGMSDPALAEDGVIQRHEGIGDLGDLTPSLHGWSGPVAKLTVRRTG